MWRTQHCAPDGAGAGEKSAAYFAFDTPPSLSFIGFSKRNLKSPKTVCEYSGSEALFLGMHFALISVTLWREGVPVVAASVKCCNWNCDNALVPDL